MYNKKIYETEMQVLAIEGESLIYVAEWLPACQ